MSLSVYNVLTRKKEAFVPMEPGKVKMYACGITASGDAHIGHALQAIVFDMIKKYLTMSGYEVIYVRNYTDVDDKIIDRAKALQMDPMQYAHQIMKKIDGELDALGVDRPTIESKATECMADIIRLVQQLQDNGYAYEAANGDVFFDVKAFARYGSFSNRILDESIHGVRIEVDPNKRDERDFALWKSAKEGEISWDSPWGKGRLGWHIECSAMSMKYLGHTLDIHGGGKDLIFPHHENEIAQSEAASGEQFSKYWLHNGLIKVNGQKMSKSLGNTVLLQDVQEKYNQDVIRLALLQSHYRSDVNITDGMFEQFEKKVYNLYKLFLAVDANAAGLSIDENAAILQDVHDKFTKAMDNDFNTALAIADLFQYISLLNRLVSEKKFQDALDLKAALMRVYAVLGLCQMAPTHAINQTIEKHLKSNNITEEEIQNLLEQRERFKAAKDFGAADEIRNHLKSHLIEVKDGKEKTEWDLMIQ
ncbi:MAG: cysteine--tRNA ligase [Oscillospiraceae bacterium]|jgi:cysteinyl-tRNA synthetase|nr:cysteine--tRNA ligase [Oscillospiraceae bacterium]